MPGPMLFATIEISLKKGWIAGPQVVLGHMVIELVLCMLIFFGAASFFGSGIISAIFLIGGLALVVFGLLTVKDARSAASSKRDFSEFIRLETEIQSRLNRPGYFRFEPLLLDLVVNCRRCSSTQGI